MKVIPLVLGMILIVAGLAEFSTALPSISNGSPTGGSGLAVTLAFAFLFGLLLLVYGLVGGGSSVPPEVRASEKSA